MDFFQRLYVTRSFRKAVRTALQALVAFLGTGGLNLILGGLDPATLGVIGVVLTTFVTGLQNGLEDAEIIPRILPTLPASSQPPEPLIDEGAPEPEPV